jgi:Fic family protein
MAYMEIKKREGKKYFYRVKSIRKDGKVGKKRVYLGVNLNKEKIKKLVEKADRELMLLSTLLSDKERKELETIKRRYSKEPKIFSENKYETFVSLFTYDSTNIEGNTLTLQETSQLLFEGITPRKSIREINEVINHKEAFDFILGYKKDISKEFILKLHEIVVKNTLKSELKNQIGKYRNIQVYIRGAKWIPTKPENVPMEMASLLSWYTKNKINLHPLILVAYFHSAFETIHPFVDGNGRVGRLLINFILHRSKYPMVNIPNKIKYRYYKALESSQIKGELRPFIILLFNLLKHEKIRF